MFGRKGKKLLAFLLSVVMTLANVDAYTLGALAAENVAQSENAGIAETEVGNTSTNETLPDGSTDAGDNAGNAILYGEAEASGEYLIDDTVDYKVTDVTVDARSYSATATVTIEGPEDSSGDYIAILYTADADADFFKGVTSVSAKNFGDIYRASDDYEWYNDGVETKNIEFVNASDVEHILKPSTTYTYRIAKRGGGVWNDEHDSLFYTYYFLSQPMTFTTKAAVTTPTLAIGDISVLSYGYDEEEIEVYNVDNPNGDTYDELRIVKKGTTEEVSYDGRNKWSKYTEYIIPTNKGELEVCTGVYTGEGEITYIRKEIPLKRRDAANRIIDITDQTGGMAISATVTINPWYSVDSYNYKSYLYWKKTEDATFKNTYSRFSGGTASVTPTGTLEENTDYQYYISIQDAVGNILAAKGSETEPLTFRTGELITYTEEDFVDKTLYARLVVKYKEPLTNAKLDTVSVFSYDHDYYVGGEGVFETLEDLPDKLPNLNTIDTPGQNIKDITPLKQMKSLKTVKLNYNDIEELPDLSDCEWTTLQLRYNYLKSEDIDINKLPKTLINDDVTNGYYRTDRLKIAATNYLDKNGNYPLFFWYGGAKGSYRTYTVIVTVDGVQKEYGRYEYKYNSPNRFCINNLKEEFDIEKEKKYTVRISVTDEFGITCTGEQEVTFTDPVDQIKNDIYVSPLIGQIELNSLYLVGSYEEESQLKNVYLVKGDEKIGTVDSDWWGESVWITESGYYLYQDLYEEYFYWSSFPEYEGTEVDCRIRIDEPHSAGDYDIVVEMVDGTKHIFPQKFHVVDIPVVKSINVKGIEGFDNSGEYYYVQLSGLNIDPTKVWPVITDINGTEYTTVGEAIASEGDSSEKNGYIFQLKKKDNWSAIESGSSQATYYIKLEATGEIIDQTEETAKKIVASYLQKTKAGLDLNPVNIYYNWKKKTVELSFGSTVSEGTEISLTVQKRSDDDEIIGTASGVTDQKGRLILVPKTAQDTIYVLEDDIHYIFTISAAGAESVQYEKYIDWYNYSYYTRTLNVSIGMSYCPVGTDTISVTASGSADKHATNHVYAKLYNSDGHIVSAQSDEFSFTEGKDGKVDTFTLKSWKLDTPLQADYYSICVYEVVEGKEKEIGRYTYLYILNPLTEGFYQGRQSITYLRNTLSDAVNMMVDLPMIVTKDLSNEKDLAALVKKYDLEVEVFDSDHNKVNASVTPLRAYASGNQLLFRIAGLDKDAQGYYFKLTSNGKVGQDILNNRYYYSDTTYGRWAAKSTDIDMPQFTNQVAYVSINCSYFDIDFPYTLKFYELGDLGTCIHTVKLGSDAHFGVPHYYFTQEDLAPLSPDEVYRCVVTSNRGAVKEYTGYFAVQSSTTSTVSVNSVSITGSGTALKPGDTLQLQAVINPTNATNQNVTWSSSDESVATVNASGLVTAVSYGSAMITVTTADGGKTATYTVNVINADDSLYVEFANGKEYEYTGGKIIPVVNVHYHGKLLVEGIDYTVKYTNNVNASKDKAQVTVTGKTIAASTTAGFSILPKQLDAEDVKAGAILVTAGSKAVPVLYYGSYKLTAKDFTNKDAAKKFTDSGSITLEGKGNFTGQRTIPVQVVGKNEIGKLAVVLKAGQRTYNGEEQPLSADELMVTDARDKSKVLTALAEDRSNADDADYMIVYPADIRSAGTVKVTIVGINHYTGSVAKSYKIAPAKKAETDFAVELPTTVTYRQDGATPAVAVSIGDEKLVVNKDYKLSYSANKKIGTAKCTVTFLGNYKGSKKIVRTYEIKPASIAEAVVAVPDKAFTKAGKYISAPFVSIDGVTLNKKDYSVKYMIGDRELTAKDKLTESDLKDGVLSVDVIVKGNGNYDAETTATGTYLIQKTSDSHDLSKAKVIIRNKNTGKKVSAFAYTGSEIKIGDPYEIYVTIGKEKRELKEGTDYRVTYVNNVNKGKATIILNGLGEDSTQDTKYYGSKTATFTIGKGILNWL